MEFKLKNVATKKPSYDIKKIISNIRNGKAILFTGAGFSFGSKNLLNKEPLGAKKLSCKLSEMSGIPLNENLMFTSDYYLAKNSPTELISLLKNNYTLTETSLTQQLICSLPWRRFYTTNYDQSIEVASQKSGKLVETVDLHHRYSEFYQRKCSLCVHINGSINSLNEESLNSSFKLSASSYVSSDGFIGSDWFYNFKADLDRASVIVFIGYSLYDIDIQKILNEDQSRKDKTFFITQENPDVELEFTLSKFGNVLAIGSDSFASFIEESYTEIDPSDDEYMLQGLSHYDVSDPNDDIRDAHVEKLLLHGDISDSAIDSFILGNTKVPLLVDRKFEDKIQSAISKGKNIIFWGALGNGKTILLKSLKTKLSTNGFDVYEIDDINADFIADIDFLASRRTHSIIMVDDYEQYLPVLEHISRTKPENITVIATARIADHEFHRESLITNNFLFDEHNIDTLNDSEVEGLVDIFDNLGSWADKASTLNKKIKYIKDKNESQVSLSLLDFYDSPVIKEKINSLVNKIKSNTAFESTLLAICLCKVIGVPATKSLISEVAGNDEIYHPTLNSMPEFKQLFHIKNGEVLGSSSIFCICLIKEHFSATQVTKHLLQIAAKFDESKHNDVIHKKVFKSMLKFSFVERILPKNTKVGNLKNYYEDLKVTITWLRNDPHFWLQYAMSFIAFENYEKAQKLIDQAYSLAEAKKDYYTDNIDTQQARLWLASCEKINDGNIVYSKFSQAHRLLCHLKDDIYKYRQIMRYSQFYDKNFSKLSKKNKQNFLDSCNEALNAINEIIEREHNHDVYIERTRSVLMTVLSKS